MWDGEFRIEQAQDQYPNGRLPRVLSNRVVETYYIKIGMVNVKD
jgi:hypothetical protein